MTYQAIIKGIERLFGIIPVKKSGKPELTYRRFITFILTDGLISKSKDGLYFIFIYPCQYLENSLTVLHDGRNISVFGVN